MIHDRLQDEYKLKLTKLDQKEKDLTAKVEGLRQKLLAAETEAKIKDLEGKIGHIELQLETLAIEREKLSGDFADLEQGEIPNLRKTDSLFSFEGKNHAVEETKESNIIELKVDGKDTYYIEGFLYKELFKH